MARSRWIKGRRRYVKLSVETCEMLSALKYRGENYDSVIRRLIQSYLSRKATVY